MAQATREVGGDIFEVLCALTPGQLRRLMRTLAYRYRRELIERWQGWAQDGQCEPPGDWRIWMIRAGRGFGKTRAGAEWISEWARMMPDLPLGEAREAWRIEIVPPVPGIGPWETAAPTFSIDAATIAVLPPGRSIAIRQIGDLALSPALFLPLT